jgi:ribosomal protein L40E
MNQKHSSEEAVIRVCENCGTENPVQAKFCGKCGQAIELASSSSPPSFQPPPTPPPITGQPGVETAPSPPAFVSDEMPFRQPAAGPVEAEQTDRGQVSLFDVRVNKMGRILDSWADIIDDAGDKEESVKTAFDQELEHREIPNVNNYRGTLSTGGLTGKRRPYHIVRSHTGTIIAVYITRFGRDLYVAWDEFVRRVVKFLNIGIMAGIATILTVLSILPLLVLAPDAVDFSLNLGWTIARIFLWMVIIVLVAAGAGLNLRGNYFAFFVKDVGHYQQVVQWQNIIVMFCIAMVLALFGMYVVGIFLNFIIICLVAFIIGRIFRGSFLAFFAEELDHFAADDATATKLMVHKSLLSAIDAAGLNTSLLRSKDTFKGGQRERII